MPCRLLEGPTSAGPAARRGTGIASSSRATTRASSGIPAYRDQPTYERKAGDTTTAGRVDASPSDDGLTRRRSMDRRGQSAEWFGAKKTTYCPAASPDAAG